MFVSIIKRVRERVTYIEARISDAGKSTGALASSLMARSNNAWQVKCHGMHDERTKCTSLMAARSTLFCYVSRSLDSANGKCVRKMRRMK